MMTKCVKAISDKSIKLKNQKIKRLIRKIKTLLVKSSNIDNCLVGNTMDLIIADGRTMISTIEELYKTSEK